MKYLFTLAFTCLCLLSLAQEKHFIFIQSDNSQPFYVSLNGKLLSSTASGYIIIPKLTDGDYDFSIGFAQNAFPEQSFQCVINKKDLGFNLKNFGDKGWGLFNLQSLNVTMATTGNSNNVAKAISESSVAKETTEPVISFDRKKEAPSVEPEKTRLVDTAINLLTAKDDGETLKQQDSGKIAKTKTVTNNSVTAQEVLDKPAPQQTAPASGVEKVSEVTSSEGVQLSFSEKNGKNTDTIQVIIPSAPSAAANAKSEVVPSPVTSSRATVEPVSGSTAKKAKEAKGEVKFLDVDLNPTKKGETQDKNQKQDNEALLVNSNCKNIASDEDYAKLRKKMAMETSDEKMISEAKKVYRNRCFTTSQIKSLSTLFLSDEGRFK
ncbi:MAG TPA: hypothetical protein VF610_02790, partial [Segetibacter sp.]